MAEAACDAVPRQARHRCVRALAGALCIGWNADGRSDPVVCLRGTCRCTSSLGGSIWRGHRSSVIVSVAWNCTVLRKSVEHAVNVLDGLLYLNQGQVDGELDPQKLCDLVVT